ncbi:hypothetical protein QR680_019192 [Steinernema hermaphroditum]|uniref:Uncharacterized protein n=1 Tax=Steinernema hermaphroditum TaxID=289476 RepID=A0AA39HMG1_9BILA|nr:hypothetical protein QR680_019192 [Steinernema hermaphroditum]
MNSLNHIYRLGLSSAVRRFCTASTPAAPKELPSKELLLQVDWMMEVLVPGFMKSRLRPFFDIVSDDVHLQDKIYKYDVKGKAQLSAHVAKVRMYYRYMSPFNKVKYQGSCVYEGEDVITVLWKMETLKTNTWSYLPKFMTQQEPVIAETEGALDMHVTAKGEVYKLVNRTITKEDRDGAKVMDEVKKEQKELREQKAKKEAEKELKQMVEDDKKNGFLRLRRQDAGGSTSRRITPNSMGFNVVSTQKPEMFQLKHVQSRLEHTVPLMFRERLDYTFYRKDVIVDNQIINVQRQGIYEVMGHLSTFSVLGQVFFPHIEMTALNILPILDDGTVRLRWRIHYLSFLRALNLMNFKRDYRIKNLKWYDGYSVFHVDGNGMVYKFTIQRTMPDESSFNSGKTAAQRLAEKIGVLPGAAASFVKVEPPPERRSRRDYQYKD